MEVTLTVNCRLREDDRGLIPPFIRYCQQSHSTLQGSCSPLLNASHDEVSPSPESDVFIRHMLIDIKLKPELLAASTPLDLLHSHRKCLISLL